VSTATPSATASIFAYTTSSVSARSVALAFGVELDSDVGLGLNFVE